MADSGPGRLSPALNRLANPPSGAGVTAPRLQHLQNLAKSLGADILLSTVGTKVSPALVLAMISVESGGKEDAVSTAGAMGLMQLMPATAERFGVSDRAIAAQSIKGGVAYLDWLMTEFDSDPILVLAGYNAGENAVKKHEGVPPYAETRDYVPKVLAAFNVAKGLCKTPPELVSDGCVFMLREGS
jgi:soluble lytic murein transglycosylase-like protein